MRKALAAAEAESAELASKLAALEKDHAALRAENHRIQSEESVQVVAANGGDEDLRRRLREIADGVLRLTKATELGETPVPTPPVGADIEQSLRTAAAKPPSIVERAPPRSARRNLAAATTSRPWMTARTKPPTAVLWQNGCARCSNRSPAP